MITEATSVHRLRAGMTDPAVPRSTVVSSVPDSILLQRDASRTVHHEHHDWRSRNRGEASPSNAPSFTFLTSEDRESRS